MQNKLQKITNARNRMAEDEFIASVRENLRLELSTLKPQTLNFVLAYVFRFRFHFLSFRVKLLKSFHSIPCFPFLFFFRLGKLEYLTFDTRTNAKKMGKEKKEEEKKKICKFP